MLAYSFNDLLVSLNFEKPAVVRRRLAETHLRNLGYTVFAVRSLPSDGSWLNIRLLKTYLG